MFRVEGAFIVNEKGKVFDVSGGKDNENQNIIVYNKHGGINQQFDVVYADEWKGEPGKGDFNPKFGLYVERPFYIISELGENRYLDLINNANFVIKVRNGRNSQTWFFDQKSLTIKTMYNKQSWNINSNGGASSMRIYSTNSNWW
jgi:hypothetical protein